MKPLQGAGLLILAVAALLVSCASAPPPSARPVENLSVDQLKGLLDRNALLFLVDTRTEYEYKKGHIPGAVNIPPYKFDAIGTLLPPDKGLHLVFYCRGSG